MAARRTFLVSAAVCATVIAGLTGCSKDGDSKSDGTAGAKKEAAATPKAPADPFVGLTADKISDKAIAATKAAGSLRMAGRVTSDGEEGDIDFTADSQGSCKGTTGPDGNSLELVQLNEVLYMKGDEDFYRAQLTGSEMPKAEADAAVELMKGRWLKMPAESAGEMGGACDVKTMISDMDDEKSDRQGMTKGPDADVNGLPAVTLVKKKTGGETLTMYVAKEGKPYLLKVVVVGGDEPGTMTFSDYDKPVKVTAPPADQVVDLDKLGGADAGTGTGSGPDA
ncbi:hypothetical protein [Streptomyces sp. NBC_00467]|uniref:hypothetical protein n=1 Tax=Streptomyces sp. NBC_00467 TaxID=2975752 RepID=UPI002E180ACA